MRGFQFPKFWIFLTATVTSRAKGFTDTSIRTESSHIEERCEGWCANTDILWTVKCEFASCMDCNDCNPGTPSFSPSSNTASPTKTDSENPTLDSGLLQINPIFILNEEFNYFLEHRRIARKFGYELASIRTEAEDLILEHFFNNYVSDSQRPIYVGGMRKQKGASFQWVDGSHFGPYQNWKGDEPDSNRKEACISIDYDTDWGWDETGCERLLKGLYRRVAPSTTVAPSASSTPSETTPVPGNCESYCYSSPTTSWEKKCKWFDCQGCHSCSSSNVVSPPSTQNCMPHCYTSPTMSWDEKCVWFDCQECPNCETSIPSIGSCLSWCNTIEILWKRKCGWSECNGCYECHVNPSELPSAAPSIAKSPTLSPTSSSCLPHCYNSPTISWSKKCNWFDCQSCDVCMP